MKFAFAAIIFSFCGQYLRAGSPNVPPYFQIQGHRGARGKRPENSIPAFQYALENGANGLEMDMGITKDNVIVINHDQTVNTTLCTSSDEKLAKLVKPLIHTLTLAQIKTYDCGKIQNKDFPEQVIFPNTKITIPTLVEVLEFLKNSPLPNAKKIMINIETKIVAANPTATVGPEEFVDMVADVIRSEHFDPDRIILESFDFRTIVYAKSKWPRLKTAALIDIGEKKSVKEILTQTKADYISPNGIICNILLVSETHRLKRKVIVWMTDTTFNKKIEWRHFARIRVDGIIADDPAPIVKDLFKSK